MGRADCPRWCIADHSNEPDEYGLVRHVSRPFVMSRGWLWAEPVVVGSSVGLHLEQWDQYGEPSPPEVMFYGRERCGEAIQLSWDNPMGLGSAAELGRLLVEIAELGGYAEGDDR